MSVLEKVTEGIENGFTITLADGRVISVRAWSAEFCPGFPALLISPERGAYSWEVLETGDLEDLAVKMEAFAPIDQWEAIHKPTSPLFNDEAIAQLNNAIAAVVQDAVRQIKSGAGDTIHKTQKPK